MWYNRIHDAAGNSVANIASHIANINPYRYRSYYYDSEGNLARKVISPTGAIPQTVFYETSEETNTVVKFQLPLAENTAIKPCVTAHSKNELLLCWRTAPYMENKRSFVDEILFEWGIQGITFDTYVDSHSSKNLIVDIYPFTILNPEKNRQVEVFYSKLLSKTVSRKYYLDCEQKYINFIRYLWLYNDTDAFFDLHFDRYFRKGLKKRRGTRLSHASEELCNIDSWDRLEELVALALREAGYMFLHFKMWNIVVMIHDFYLLVLCKEEKTVSMIRELSEKSGLFARTLELF